MISPIKQESGRSETKCSWDWCEGWNSHVRFFVQELDKIFDVCCPKARLRRYPFQNITAGVKQTATSWKTDWTQCHGRICMENCPPHSQEMFKKQHIPMAEDTSAKHIPGEQLLPVSHPRTIGPMGRPA